ncbi:hypothetical protein PanWU01x14_370220 [Parasponia andersonii]|uniref:Uncharacterized protein n=1 Tax=Parasponia andersonii TaxID=3476 RepID=A0A2P5A4C9_PARAD|nr:hypothetical protein PanWU01x14_370220 [Parasponia andersonii]
MEWIKVRKYYKESENNRQGVERCAADLKQWSGSKFGNITRKVRTIDKELKFAYNGPQDSFSTEAIRKLKKDRD